MSDLKKGQVPTKENYVSVHSIKDFNKKRKALNHATLTVVTLLMGEMLTVPLDQFLKTNKEIRKKVSEEADKIVNKSSKLSSVQRDVVVLLNFKFNNLNEYNTKKGQETNPVEEN